MRNQLRRELEIRETDRLLKEAEARVAEMKEDFLKEKEARDQSFAKEHEKRIEK